MRITDSRYDRDRHRLAVAYRLIRHEARTQTIRQATSLSGDRIRKLYREYFKGQPVRTVRRRRGKSPRQMSFFRRSPAHELQAAALAALLQHCGFISRPRAPYRPSLDETSRFCDVYEAFCSLCPATVISFEHAWHLWHVLARLDEFVLARCPDCRGTWIRDTLDLLPDNCPACRAHPPDLGRRVARLRARTSTSTAVRTPNVFAGPYLDRAAHLRKDAAYVAAALADPDTLITPLWRARNLVHQVGHGCGAAFISVAHEIRSAQPDGEFVLLGQFRGRACFAVDLPAAAQPVSPPGATFEDLRATGALLPEDEAGLLAYARAMVLWRQRHRYCGSCGAPTHGQSAGHVMKCSSTGCGAEHFPRLDPAIIVLVTDGERALLGRQAAWPPGRYSTIAGFVEPGESLEDAVAREVLEETGVTVVEAEYHSSQPWPFPSSLMIGFTARAAEGSVPRADEELEDARWFTREQIASGEPRLPPRQSVSLRLIEDWYDSAADVPLRATPGWASQGWG